MLSREITIFAAVFFRSTAIQYGCRKVEVRREATNVVLRYSKCNIFVQTNTASYNYTKLRFSVFIQCDTVLLLKHTLEAQQSLWSHFVRPQQ